MILYCCGCVKDVEARLTNGNEIYRHRNDLRKLPFWICDTCKNFVGCHYKTNNPTQPLGSIATKELKNARKYIHAILDPIWQSKKISRKKLYARISEKVGYKYHTAEIRTLDQAREIYKIIRDFK